MPTSETTRLGSQTLLYLVRDWLRTMRPPWIAWSIVGSGTDTGPCHHR